jgi:hypothetical protein
MGAAFAFPSFAPARPTTHELTLFFRRVAVDRSGCWVWTGALNWKGYGSFKGTSAHRFPYAWFVEPIAAGLTVDHLCRNRACVNPAHCEAVSDSENKRRASTFNRLGVCRRRGHVLAEVGIEHTSADGLERACAECHRLARARYVLRKQGPNNLPAFAVRALKAEADRLNRSASKAA